MRSPENWSKYLSRRNSAVQSVIITAWPKSPNSKAGDTPMKNKPKCELRHVVLLRHGESVWNKENLFSGWTDVDLSDHGSEEGRQAGLILKEHGFSFDVAFTSVLKRAIRTLWLLLDKMDLMWIPVRRDWRLNERHYGALQELNIPTGIPLVYELDEDLTPIHHNYLGDTEDLQKAMQAVASQASPED